MIVEELWCRYREKVIHPDAPADQLREMRIAFYGGAGSLLNFMLGHLETTDDVEPTDDDMALMDRIARELREFKP